MNVDFIICIFLILILFLLYLNFKSSELFNYTNNENTKNDTKICYITAIYGSYESSCKKYIKQTINSDFICFTDNKNIKSNGWTIDITPYHYLNKSKLDNDSFVNSISNNKHTFNIAKYYKQAFRNIPILKKYDVIVWLDGTIEITNNKTSEWILNNIYNYKVIGWIHGYSKCLEDEVNSSNFLRYNSMYWNSQQQPIQNVNKQYAEYLKEGYDINYFSTIDNREGYGIWITCFVAFLNNDEVNKFLDLWYLQTLKYSTQDQVSFPFVVQKSNLIPYTLPDNEIKCNTNPHFNTDFYIKHEHGK
jgi:hypothetical protein